MPQITGSDLSRLPTLSVGQAADLKIDTGTMRVWVSRCTLTDGELSPIQVEQLIDGQWVDVTTPERWDGHVCEYKNFTIDGGRYRGFRLQVLTRNRRD